MTNDKSNLRIKLTLAIGSVVLFAVLMVFLFSGDNFLVLKSIITENHTGDELKMKLREFGVRGYITISFLSMLQVVLTFIPAEPTQMLAGITFGFRTGIACCMAGIFLGNTVVFLIYKLFGDKVREYFITNLRFDFDKAAKSKRVFFLVLMLYFLPAIPYGMICFFAASVGMKYPRYIFVTLLGAVPSVCIGVILGHVAISYSWIVSILVFIIIISLLLVAMLKREAIFAKVNAYADRPPYSSKTTVRAYGPLTLLVPHVISRIVIFFKGVRVKYINKLNGKIKGPAIVIANHGSFVDFVYAGTLIRKSRPNFVVARLYFYKKLMGNILRRVGCFPKSMFTADLESVKNCIRVLRSGGVLAMMPEARLSTVGRFEDIQEGTYSFIKKSAVPVYSIKINGDYFASPKWGNGLRRGSRVFAELDTLFTAEDIERLSVEEIKDAVEARLYYDEFEWIKTQPKIRYRSRKLAEGLENILTRCPTCHSKCTIKTKGRKISCEKCGHLATLDQRYSFVEDFRFNNFAQWYDWQREVIKKEISDDPECPISSDVELLLRSSDGKKMLRTAGYGTCRLNAAGLDYEGTLDGEKFSIHFPTEQIYRLLFGAGENFEIYVGSEIYYFRPIDRRSAVDWYIASEILSDMRKATD